MDMDRDDYEAALTRAAESAEEEDDFMLTQNYGNEGTVTQHEDEEEWEMLDRYILLYHYIILNCDVLVISILMNNNPKYFHYFRMQYVPRRFK